ncbi:simple sugar transport system substrate-binding protein [Kaistia hirudinis]|uniref:Simple sugar transport system substrate-binding protein n=1 Tax=Kaistia hirudinis TaxID=1293440 RepID=A0A840AMH4_9HYPH|nr:substrate-binding domain-containing protein [Kaistia hirudinis]MBB3930237.1 simple sugar transport system substrate-binding protein [Kaistia hirudinis]
MRNLMKGLAGLALSAFLVAPLAAPAQAQEAADSGLTMYFQMGGNPGDTATLARELGAREAARILKVNLIEQHSGWDPQKMLVQASEALAAAPDAIAIMGHPGVAAMTPFLNKAKEEGVVVVLTDTNLPGTGLNYFGADSYGAGRNLADLAVKDGKLKAGDKVLVYGAFIEGAAGAITAKGTVDYLKENGLGVETLQWTQEAVLDPSLSVPVLVAYLESNPDTKAILVPGHGGVTAVLAKVLKDAGKKPGEVTAAGFDISSASIQGVKDGYITAVLDQQPYLQGFYGVLSAVLQKKYGLGNTQMFTSTGSMTKDNVELLEALVKTGIR